MLSFYYIFSRISSGVAFSTHEHHRTLDFPPTRGLTVILSPNLSGFLSIHFAPKKGNLHKHSSTSFFSRTLSTWCTGCYSEIIVLADFRALSHSGVFGRWRDHSNRRGWESGGWAIQRGWFTEVHDTVGICSWLPSRPQYRPWQHKAREHFTHQRQVHMVFFCNGFWKWLPIQMGHQVVFFFSPSRILTCIFVCIFGEPSCVFSPLSLEPWYVGFPQILPKMFLTPAKNCSLN